MIMNSTIEEHIFQNFQEAREIAVRSYSNVFFYPSAMLITLIIILFNIDFTHVSINELNNNAKFSAALCLLGFIGMLIYSIRLSLSLQRKARIIEPTLHSIASYITITNKAERGMRIFYTILALLLIILANKLPDQAYYIYYLFIAYLVEPKNKIKDIIFWLEAKTEESSSKEL